MSLHALLSPEARLLLLAAAPAPDGAALARAAGCPGLDWERLARLAEKERATSTLWRALRAAAAPVPREWAARLERLALRSDVRMLHHQRRLAEALDLLGAAGIEVVLLKGAGLAATVYRSFADRPMSDLDLLVPPARAREAWEALGGAGWTHDGAALPADFYGEHHHLPPLDDPSGTGLSVEIHTAPWAGAVRAPEPSLRERARPVEVAGRRALVPAPEHQVLHLCVHFAWAHLLRSAAWRTFRDLHHLLAAGPIDWEALARTARRTRGASCCYWTLSLARALAGLPVPDAVLAALRPRLPAALHRAVERHFVGAMFDFGPAPCPSLRLGRLLWTAGIAPRRSGHGGLRPWTRDHVWLSLTGAPAPLDPAGRLRRHLAGAAGWARYLRSLLPLPQRV